jgi:trk system potassium uptake protein TrkA
VHIVILGCGRVGSALARSVEKLGHDVSIIDQDPASFLRLPETFVGQRVTGMGFDRNVLVEAGIERAGAFAAVSSGDNSNIIAARVAREMFGVERVIARIYDPRRAEVYERLGIPTVATVRWTRDQILSRLLPDTTTPEWTDTSGTISLIETSAPAAWVGRKISALEEYTGVRVACVTRFGDGMLPDARTVVQDGDVLHLVQRKDRIARTATLLSEGPEERTT